MTGPASSSFVFFFFSPQALTPEWAVNCGSSSSICLVNREDKSPGPLAVLEQKDRTSAVLDADGPTSRLLVL